MTRISNAEQVLLLLRAHLERSGKSRRKQTSRQGSQPISRRGPLERLRQLASEGELPRQEIARALLAGLIAEDLGEGAVNDPSFQRLLDEVHKRVAGDEEAKRLMERALDQLLEQKASS